MKRKRGTLLEFGVRGTVGALAGVLLAAACGKTSNLGDDLQPAGGDGAFAEAGGGGGDGVGGTAVGGTSVGGTTAAGGPTNMSDGGVAGDGSLGGASGATGMGGDGGAPDALPYPLAPTVPAPADCGCESDEVCNAAHVCVPRCEPGGVCAVWRIERNVTSVRGSGDAMYFVLAPARDSLGNPLPDETGKESLWKAVYPGEPQRLASLTGAENEIMAIFGGKTYLRRPREAVIAIDDDGSATQHALPANTRAVAVSQSGVFAELPEGAVWRLELGADGTVSGGDFAELISAPSPAELRGGLFVEERLWYVYDGSRVCSLDWSVGTASEQCMSNISAGTMVAARGGRVFRYDYGIVEVNVDEQTSRTLARLSQKIPRVALGDGFMTAWTSDFDSPPFTLVRFPTDGPAQAPTALFSERVRDAMASISSSPHVSDPALVGGFAYWAPFVWDPTGSSVAHYIFRAPVTP
jgi:hypothetical protein